MRRIPSRSKVSNFMDILEDTKLDGAARAITLSNLREDSAEILGLSRSEGKWTTVKCHDGSHARILRNPNDAFQIYATEWNTKFRFVADLLSQAKVGGDIEVQNKVARLFENLGSVEASLREMYKNAYLTFAATPCNEKSQEEKRRMDRLILAASLHLVSFKVMLENKDPKNVDAISNEMIRLIDKITSLAIN